MVVKRTVVFSGQARANLPGLVLEIVPAGLNMVRTVQQNVVLNVSIGLLRDRIGRHSWILTTALLRSRLCVYPDGPRWIAVRRYWGAIAGR